MKRLLDIFISLIGLIIASPVIFLFFFLIWRQDKHSPIYSAKRVGKNGKIINVYKLRSMIMNADKKGGDSTSGNDVRITPVGHFIRAYKIDELVQLWNVFIGNMSLVGPRPNVERDVNLYKNEEKKLLSIKPGITDFSSIVFSDEGDILKDEPDPDLAFNQLIRPWKIRLGLFYVQHHSVWLDCQLILLTVLAIFSKQSALKIVVKILKKYHAADDLVQIARRESKLMPCALPMTDAS